MCSVRSKPRVALEQIEFAKTDTISCYLLSTSSLKIIAVIEPSVMKAFREFIAEVFDSFGYYLGETKYSREMRNRHCPFVLWIGWWWTYLNNPELV